MISVGLGYWQEEVDDKNQKEQDYLIKFYKDGEKYE